MCHRAVSPASGMCPSVLETLTQPENRRWGCLGLGHGMTEWIGLEGTFNMFLTLAPAMGRVTFQVVPSSSPAWAVSENNTRIYRKGAEVAAELCQQLEQQPHRPQGAKPQH